MDRKRLVRQIKAKGITVGSESLKIVRELGSGGNGVAFLCQAKERDPIVAKVYIPPDSRDLDERACKRFKNEISLISKITVFELLVRIDEPKAWPDIKKAVEDNDIRSSFRVKRYVGHLSQSHQIEFLTKWLEQNTSDGYAVENMVDAVLALELPNTTRLAFLRKLDRKLGLLPGSFRNLYPLKQRVATNMQRVATNMNSLQAEIGVSFP